MSEDTRCKSSTLIGTSQRIERCLKDAGHDVDTTPDAEDSIHASKHANWTNSDPGTQDVDDDYEDDDEDEDEDEDENEDEEDDDDILDEEFDGDYISEDEEEEDELTFKEIA
jgi:hypothetical protein